MLQTILVPVSIVTGTGLIAGLLLSIASKFFAVKVDETVANLREVLPGANCGACGCAGCDEYASKMAAGEAPPNLCPVGGAPVAAKLGEIWAFRSAISSQSVRSLNAAGICRPLSTSWIMMVPRPARQQNFTIMEEPAAILPAWDTATAPTFVNTMRFILWITLRKLMRISALAAVLAHGFARIRFWSFSQEARRHMLLV